MKTLSEIASAIDEILATDWVRRAGQQIPTTEDVKLGNDAVELDGAVLYADLVESTALVNSVKDSVAAEMYKVYLYSACELIRNNGGQITAFDGDRVMGVFIGEKKDDSAAKCALQDHKSEDLGDISQVVLRHAANGWHRFWQAVRSANRHKRVE